MSRQIDLELLECKPFKNGCVLVKYQVKNKASRERKRPEKNPQYFEVFSGR